MKDFRAPLYLVIALTCSTGTSVHGYIDDNDYRLPKTLVPSLYSFVLTIDPDTSGFNGSMHITLHGASEDTNTTDIYLHYDPDFVEISGPSLDIYTQCSVGPPSVANIAIISCAKPIVGKEEHVLFMRFSTLYATNGDYGMSKTKYKYQEEDHVQIQSYFKPNFARRAFPCMDEPGFEASFEIHTEHPINYKIISNSRITADGWIFGTNRSLTRFVASPKMSPHLLSIFMSSMFEGKTLATNDGTDTRFFARQEIVNLTLGVAESYYSEIVNTLSNYTGFPYHSFSDNLSYHVAVPDYSDAMGGLSLFAYRETDILDEGDKTTRRTLQNIITTMAYKLSQQWYGGYVSTTWWSDVWANEAVASYLKYIIPDKINESLELGRQFVIENTQKALLYDAMPFDEPLSSNESDVNHYWDIQDRLDPINYQKGASILHMINYMLGGGDKFEAALRNHFENRKDSDTDGMDLINDLFSIQEKYYEYMQSWVFSAGFPLVTVRLTNEDDQVAEATLSQKRFIYPTENMDEDDTQWYIPISSTTHWAQNFTVIIQTIFEPREEKIYLFGSNQWILFNLQGGCFFRVNYDEALWGRIMNTLKTEPEDINVLHRAQLIDDVFNVARIGDVSYSLAFEVAEFLATETAYYPWYSAFNAFSYLLGKMENEEFEEAIQNYLLNLMDNILEIPDTDSGASADDTHTDILRKVMVLDWACFLRHPDCLAYTNNKFKDYTNPTVTLEDLNDRGVILCNGVRQSEDLDNNFWILSYIYEASTSVQEQNDILRAYGCAEDKDMLKMHLSRIITEDHPPKKQDVMVIFNSVFSSSVGLEAAMEFLEGNITDIYSFYNDVNLLSQMIYAVAEKLFTDDHIIWLNNFLNITILDDYDEFKTKALGYVSVNNYWIKHFRAGVEEVFPFITTKGVPITSSTELPDTTSTTESTTTTTITTTSSTSTEAISTTTESGNDNGFKAKYSVVLVALGLQMWFYKYKFKFI